MSQFFRKLFGRSRIDDENNEDSPPPDLDQHGIIEKAGDEEMIDPENPKPNPDKPKSGLDKKDPMVSKKDDSESTIRLPKESAPQATAIDLPPQRDTGSTQFDPHALMAAGDSAVGWQRDHNEDAFFLVTYHPQDNQKKFNFGLYIVADGMGGHQYGERASQAAVNVVSESLIKQVFDPVLAGKQFKDETELHQLLQNAYQKAHLSIQKDAPGGGTTVTTLLVLDNTMTIAHIGDSRAYCIAADGTSRVLTRDHSFVNKLIELGHITSEEAAVHPQRNVLYRALGQGESYEADIETQPLPSNGHLLICSDGLWGVVPEHQIISVVKSNSHPDQACKKLIALANSAGGPDNITAILVRLPS